MKNVNNLPTQKPAVGGWFWNEKKERAEFLMPPYPGVDDCICVDGKWCYRSLVTKGKNQK